MKSKWVCSTFAAALFAVAGILSAQDAQIDSEAPTAEIRLDLNQSPPLVPPTGKVEAYQVSNVKQLLPGQLADTYFGDYVLKNNTVSVTISHPEKEHVAGIGGGHIIDVLSARQNYDYLNYVQLIPDVESTASRVLYTYADEPIVENETTATLVLHGKAEVTPHDDPNGQPLELDVTTSYSLAADSNLIRLSSTFRNSTSETVFLLPGDLIDWGQANTFVEGVGHTGSGSIHRSNFALGFADDFSLGYVTSGTEQVQGLYTLRDALMTFALPDAEIAPAAQAPEDRMRAPEAPDRGGFGRQPSNDPMAELMRRAREAAAASPTVETAYGTETGYGTTADGGITTTSLSTRSTTETLQNEAGTTGTLLADEVTTTPHSGKVPLAPGESINFDRFLILSDRDFSRIARFAYETKEVEIATVAGAVLETGSERPIAGADVFISGGPTWNGRVTPSAFYRTGSRGDGTFAAQLPPGKYMISAGKIGRSSATPRKIVDITTGSQPQILALSLTPECIVSIAVSQAETETSSPVPCKVTFIPKQGTMAPDWGMGPRADRGVRNVYYLPYGAARIPVSPGNYQVLISRGIEYDVVREDLRVMPGTNPVLAVSLPHSLKGTIPGLFSIDAGLMTTASAVSNAAPEDRVIQAVCEGVHLIASGDYNEATNLQAVIERMGLQDWIKAFVGMRLLFHKGDQSGEVLAFPLNPDQAIALRTFVETLKDLPPDVAMSDLRRKFPDIFFTIVGPSDPLKGYLAPFAFNDRIRQFEEGQIPPPDFDAISILEGKKLGVETLNYPRYMDMQISRTQPGPEKSTVLAAIGGSYSRFTYGEEVGYPRVYLYTTRDSFKDVTAEDVVTALKGQRFLVTNGPIVLPKVQKLPEGDYVHKPGDVVDLSTTEVLRLRVEVYAAPWVTLSGIAIREYGWVQSTISEIRPHQAVRRYPVQEPGQIITRYLQKDAILDVQAYSNRRSLHPIVPDASPDFGGPVYPMGFSAPIFVDKNGDGRIELEHDKSMMPKEPPPPPPPPDAQEPN